MPPVDDEPFGPVLLVADAQRVADARASAAVVLSTLAGSGLAASLADDDKVEVAVAAALGSGIRFLAVIGNDQSFRAMCQAIVDAGFSSGEVTVFLIPATPDCDLIRTFGLPTDPAAAARHLLGDNHYDLDLVRATATGTAGEPVEAVFAQVSEAGFGARLARGAAGRSGGQQRRGRFTAFWKGVLTTRATSVRLQIDRKTWQGKTTGIVVGNTSFFHDGLRVSPRSFPGDGVIDVLAWHGPRSDIVTLLPKMYRGEHLPQRGIEEFRAKIGVSIEGEGLPVHADGVMLGTTPARYVIMPAAVKLKL